MMQRWLYADDFIFHVLLLNLSGRRCLRELLLIQNDHKSGSLRRFFGTFPQMLISRLYLNSQGRPLSMRARHKIN